MPITRQARAILVSSSSETCPGHATDGYLNAVEISLQGKRASSDIYTLTQECFRIQATAAALLIHRGRNSTPTGRDLPIVLPMDAVSHFSVVPRGGQTMPPSARDDAISGWRVSMATPLRGNFDAVLESKT
uniref:Uncharacterized protein n=1 Tax=Anopheles coluzzii TaxID=1518534 RepID=A0A8W7P1R4_ANOCL